MTQDITPAAPNTRGKLTDRPWVLAAITFAVGLIVGFGASEGSREEPVTPASSAAEAADEGESQPAPPDEEDAAPEPEPEPEENPDATFTETCDYLLGDSLDDHTLIGQTRVENTGNIGITVKATFLWYQAGGPPVKQVKETDIDTGRKKIINAELPADSNIIDRLQALPYDQQCKVKVALVDTYGSPE